MKQVACQGVTAKQRTGKEQVAGQCVAEERNRVHIALGQTASVREYQGVTTHVMKLVAEKNSSDEAQPQVAILIVDEMAPRPVRWRRNGPPSNTAASGSRKP